MASLQPLRPRAARVKSRLALLVHERAAPRSAFVVQYEELGVERPANRVLGVYSSEASAREALRELDRARSLVVHASITSWLLDVAGPQTAIEIEM